MHIPVAATLTLATGLAIERALTIRLIGDVIGRPNALPMLSHALLETWRRRRGRLGRDCVC